MDGVLKSWAVPKEPPTVPNIRRLAIEVEDHPVEYITFEGRIPEGEYGAGTVEIWDSGVYNLKKREDRVLELDFDGNRLNGSYKLVKFREKQWLLFKSQN
jgi:DNA ligase D-like protein (predicted 3'-phosphoesterase)